MNNFSNFIDINDIFIDKKYQKTELNKKFYVYVLYDLMYNILYIGKTIYIKDRIQRHLKTKSTIKFVKYAICTTEEEQISLEFDLILNNKSVYNKKLIKDFYTKVDTKKIDNSIHDKEFKATNAQGEVFYSTNKSEFAKIHNLDESTLCKVLKKSKGFEKRKYKGWDFEYI